LKTLLLLPPFAMLVFSGHHTQTPPDGSQITVLSFKWSKSRQTLIRRARRSPCRRVPITQADKNYERNARVNDPAGTRDPNADTLDGRGAALERSVRDAEKSQAKPVNTFTYQANGFVPGIPLMKTR
jgi:hypothetical protein